MNPTTITMLKVLFLVCGSPMLTVTGCEHPEQSVGRALSFTLLILGMFMVLMVPDSLT